MKDIKKLRGSWVITDDGSIGVLLYEKDGTPMIASGEPGNYTALDEAPNDWIIVGAVMDCPTYEIAIEQVIKIQKFCQSYLKPIDQ